MKQLIFMNSMDFVFLSLLYFEIKLLFNKQLCWEKELITCPMTVFDFIKIYTFPMNCEKSSNNNNNN